MQADAEWCGADSGDSRQRNKNCQKRSIPAQASLPVLTFCSCIRVIHWWGRGLRAMRAAKLIWGDLETFFCELLNGFVMNGADFNPYVTAEPP